MAPAKRQGRFPYKHFDPAQLHRPGSLQALLARHLQDLEMRNYSPDTVDVRRKTVLQFIDYLAERGVTDAAQVSRAMLERYQQHLFRVRKPNGQPLGISTQCQRLKTVVQFFRWLVRKHLLPSNPAADLDYPRPIKRLPDVLSPQEAEAVLRVPDTTTAGGLRDRAILETFYSTGIRRMEMVQLSIFDLDHDQRLLRVVQGKGRKDRVVPIGARALSWVQRYLDEARPRLVADLEEHALFVSRFGRPFGRIALGELVRRYLNRAEIRKTGSCHLFRHSMATGLLAGGCDIRLIQGMLGHASLATTAGYTRLSVQQLKAAHRACHPAENPAAAEAAESGWNDEAPADR